MGSKVDFLIYSGNWNCANGDSCNYTATISIPETAAPVFDPAGPAIIGDTVVTISSATPGAVIYYTTDGKDPTASGTQYSNPTTVTVTNGTTLKAIAVGTDTSNVKTQTYIYAKAPAPSFSAGSPYISGPTYVKITSTVAGATIYYTFNGNTPTTSDEVYTEPIWVNDYDQLQAIVVADGYNASDVTNVLYRVPENYNRPETISGGSAKVDGDLSDWSGAAWVPLNVNYDGAGASDVTEAYYAAKWQSNKVYVAVKVNDTAHYFTTNYSSWNGRDAVEVYIHTDNTGDANYNTSGWTSAQQYTAGIMKGTTDSVWACLASTDQMPADAGFKAAGKVDGNWIYYEFAMTPFTYFGGYIGETSSVSNLFGDEVIGLDVCVVSSNAGTYTGMRAENDMKSKFGNWYTMGLHKLVCISGDANLDGAVDVGDLGILAANYGKTSGATWSQGDFNGDGAVDVGDLGILAANYGTGSSSGSSFEADYAKVFGTDSTSTEMTDDSSTVCSSLGLSLVAGLAMLGLMLVKLEE